MKVGTGDLCFGYKSHCMSNDTTTGTIRKLEALLSTGSDPQVRVSILPYLRELDVEQLATVIGKVDIACLIETLDPQGWGPDSLKEFLRLLSTAHTYLEIASKASIIDSLARHHNGPGIDQAIETLICSESGEHLTRLKLALEAIDGGVGLVDLLYDCIDDAEVRFDLISYFQKESADPDKLQSTVRVVASLKDTLYTFQQDHQHPDGPVEPEAVALLSRLSPYSPIFIAPRPEHITEYQQTLTAECLAAAGVAPPTLLEGNIPGLLGHRHATEQKVRALTRYCELYPEFKFIFIGNSESDDVRLATALSSGASSIFETVMIRKLQETHPVPDQFNPFRTYSDAVKTLIRKGYLNA